MTKDSVPRSSGDMRHDVDDPVNAMIMMFCVCTRFPDRSDDVLAYL
jgi:hypothetical protein